MHKRRPSTNNPAARNQRHRNLSRHLRKRHLHLKHRQREVQRMREITQQEADQDNNTPDTTS